MSLSKNGTSGLRVERPNWQLPTAISTTLLYQTKSHSDTDLHPARFMFYVPAGVGWYNAPTLLQLTPHHMWSGRPTFTLLPSDVTTHPRNIWHNMYLNYSELLFCLLQLIPLSLRRVGCSSKHDPVCGGVSPSVGGAVATVPVSTAAQLLVSSRQEHISSSTSSVQWHDAEVSISQPPQHILLPR